MSCAIVVLGSPNDENGNLLPIAISRAEKAIEVFNRHSDSKILCTGGFGLHFNETNTPHAQYLKEYLIAKGIPESSFLETALSSFTLEDATLSQPILEKHVITDCILVTSEFHMERAKLVFGKVMPNMNFEYSAANTEISQVKFEQLVQHEKMAIKREIENFKLNNELKNTVVQ